MNRILAMFRKAGLERDLDAEFEAISIGLVLLGIAGLASWIPARRATRVNPVTALQYQ